MLHNGVITISCSILARYAGCGFAEIAHEQIRIYGFTCCRCGWCLFLFWQCLRQHWNSPLKVVHHLGCFVPKLPTSANLFYENVLKDVEFVNLLAE